MSLEPFGGGLPDLPDIPDVPDLPDFDVPRGPTPWGGRELPDDWGDLDTSWRGGGERGGWWGRLFGDGAWGGGSDDRADDRSSGPDQGVHECGCPVGPACLLYPRRRGLLGWLSGGGRR